MPTTTQVLSVERLTQKLNQISINQLAKNCGFIKRKPKKIWPVHLLISLFLVVLGAGNSLSNLAAKIGLLSCQTISKQSVFKRINENLLEFLQAILAKAMVVSSKINYEQRFSDQLFSRFNRVLVEDSTSIKLAPKLVADFPGSRNQTGKKSATLKIHACIDILTEQFCYFDISAFAKNDQSAAEDILTIANASDLVIRDLGYFTLAAFKKLQLAKIFFFEPAKIRCPSFSIRWPKLILFIG
jgi:hypothetical protein